MNKSKGQFFTPKEIADLMVKNSIKFIKKKRIEILDPCFGEGIFFESLLKIKKIKFKLYGHEIETKFYNKVISKFKNKIDFKSLKNSDYLLSKSKLKFDFIILNPPYVRHEIISKKFKKKLIISFEKQYSTKIDQKSNLYVYFLLKVMQDLKMGGICTLIVDDIIDQTKYGKKLMQLIKNNCRILKVIKLKTPFKNVLIDAKIIILKKEKLNKKNLTEIKINGFTDLSNLVDIKRGLGLISKKTFQANKDDRYFYLSKKIILKSANINKDNKLITPSYAYIFSSEEIIPYILKKNLLERYKQIHKKNLKSLNHNLKKGPIIFNYFFRDNIEFFENYKNLCVSDNFYILKPKYLSITAMLIILNSKIFKYKVINNSRNQGSGLFKIQRYELAEIKLPDWSLLNKSKLKRLNKKIIVNKNNEKIINKIIETPILNETTKIH